MTFLDEVKDVGFRLVPKLHRALLHATGGRALGSAFGMPVVELHTVGRRTGLERVTMLTAPIADDSKVVLVASKGGDDRDPTWLLNLRANPEVQVTIRGDTRALRARIATADEKAAMWPQIVGAYRGYAGYQKRTTRDIPVVICERP
jgi:deazaflavin-dependent oxidoreductase (nitroreductase family)